MEMQDVCWLRMLIQSIGTSKVSMHLAGLYIRQRRGLEGLLIPP